MMDDKGPHVQIQSYTHFSDGFNSLLDIWPKGYLTFPSKEVRGQSASKASITITNVNHKPVAFRIVNEQNNTLDLRVCPSQCVLAPHTIQRVDIFNASDHSCGISDRVYIEAIIYERHEHSSTSETFDNLSDRFQEKSVNYYCLKCYETNDLAFLPLQEQLFRVQQRLTASELTLKRLNQWFDDKNKRYLYPFLPVLLVFIATVMVLYAHYSLNQTNSCHCAIKRRIIPHVTKKVLKPVVKAMGRFDVTILDKYELYRLMLYKQCPRRFGH